MTRFLLALLLTTPLIAQNADLSISAAPVGAVFHNLPAEVAIVVTNGGPVRATNVVVTSSQAMDGGIDPRCGRVDAGFRCVADAIEPGTSVTFRARTGSHSTVRPMQYPLAVSSDQPDPNPANNSYLLLVDWLDQSSASVQVSVPPALDPQKRGTVRVSFENRSAYAATDAKLIVRVSHLARLIAVTPALDCTTTTGEIVCSLPAVAPHSRFEAAFEVELLLETASYFGALVEWGDLLWGADQLATYYRDFEVTTTADSGPGSLRQAILDANALCTANELACRIRFAIAEPRPLTTWYTIQPRTPLPEVLAAWITVDGRTQLDVYPNGPDVFLDGSAANADGPGLSFGSFRASVYGLAIGNFRGNGILIRTGVEHVINGNYLGVDPTGSRAAGNGGRGVEVLSGGVVVENNVLSGNGRSGGFFWCRNVAALGNRIGVAAHSDAPIGNGASGIFIGPRGAGYGPASVAANVIANNRDFGVALAGFAIAIVERNRIFDNVQGGIDIGLDGPDTDLPTSMNVPTPPQILSARFDGTATIIEGLAHPGSDPYSVFRPQAVELYANATVDAQGYAEGERLLGLAAFQPGSYRFTLRHEGDLRGRWITGIMRQHSTLYGGEYSVETTSEFSKPLKVE